MSVALAGTGVLAGAGRLPLLLLAEARRLGAAPPVVALERVSLPATARAGGPSVWLRVGQLGRAARFLAESGACRVVLAGGVPWSLAEVRPRPDRAALRLAPALARGDDALLRRLAAVFEEAGLRVVGPGPMGAPLLPPPGRLAGPEPTPRHLDSARRAWRGARGLGARDRGQAAVARGREVLLEDRRGTDALLRRAGRRAGRGLPRGVLAKVAKPGQDRRFDLPAIGPATIAAASRAGLAGVVVEAGATLVLDLGETAALADRLGVGLWCWPG